MLYWKKAVRSMGNMETKQTKWEVLSISNAPLFGMVMQDPEDSYAAKLEEAVEEAKKNREWIQVS